MLKVSAGIRAGLLAAWMALLTASVLAQTYPNGIPGNLTAGRPLQQTNSRWTEHR